MKFRITRTNGIPVGEAARSIIVEADRWWDARHLGVLHFGCERSDLAFESNPVGQVTIEMRWDGRPPNQRLQFRTRNENTVIWTDWHDIEDYVVVHKASDVINNGNEAQPTE